MVIFWVNYYYLDLYGLLSINFELIIIFIFGCYFIGDYFDCLFFEVWWDFEKFIEKELEEVIFYILKFFDCKEKGRVVEVVD